MSADRSLSATVAHFLDGVPRHVLSDNPLAGFVVFDELMPSASGAKLDTARNADDHNAVAIGFSPAIFDPAGFPDFACDNSSWQFVTLPLVARPTTRNRERTNCNTIGNSLFDQPLAFAENMKGACSA